jgi:excisionase family DNA binding protein
MIHKNFFNIEQAAKYLQCSKQILRKWESEGLVLPFRTPGGHRRYLQSDLDKLTHSPENNNFIGRFNTFTYTEIEIENLIEFIKRNAKSGIIVTIEKA